MGGGCLRSEIISGYHNQYQQEIKDFIQLIRDSSTSEFIAVMNPESLSFYETKRIIDYLRKIDVRLSKIVVNKFEEFDFLVQIEKEFSKYKIIKIPIVKNPVGVENIKKICEFFGDV